MDNAAINKDLEANGHVEETRSVSDGSTSEQLNPYRKRSRRMEYLYISIAVILGAALIAVLVYFSVINAAKKEPETVGSQVSASTTPDYDYLFGDVQDDADDNFNGGSQIGSNTRNVPVGGMSRSADPPAETTTKRSFQMVGSNGGGNQPNSGLLRRMQPPETTTTTSAPRMALRGLQRRMLPGPPNTDGESVTSDSAEPDEQTEANTGSAVTTSTSSPENDAGSQRTIRMISVGNPMQTGDSAQDSAESDEQTGANTGSAVTTSTSSPENDAGSQRSLRMLHVGNPIQTGDSAQGGVDKTTTQSPDNDGGDGQEAGP